ncbi:MAG TPA: hypothetical protein VFQ53_07515 [Kofleriaceae bacterium]|nr:hypothetical protein [Kofleriaceae bacterium]
MTIGSDVQEVLKAGGMVPANAKLGKDDAVDTVVARAYRHGVLPGRTVIRLTAESVATGDDLEMATLGFGAGEDRGAVGKERKRPLGFPGWALVHDPKNARYALDVVKEFKKQARKAKSKPGHAKEAIDKIAQRLGKSVPHFLPSFYEEAGRAFIEHGAAKYAAEMFGKAREAEAVHALDVDEQHRVDGFLEFALAGAVTTKALTQYAKELAEHHAPDVAYAHFRQLCLQRTLGGMPPWSGMAKELGRLAKAAKLDPKTEDAAFVAEIIESPALAKAAGEFWRAYAEPITELAKQSSSARGALLNLFPTGATYNADLDDAWLDLLDATGASAALVSDDVPDDARCNGGRAAWFDKLTTHLARNWRSSKISARAFELLRRMAGKLAADGKPIHCCGRWNRLDVDLLELALELGVPVDHGEAAPYIDLGTWAKHATDPERGRDPVRAAAHPKYGPLLAAAVASEIGDEPFDTVSRNKAGLLAAKRTWLEGVIAKAEAAALPDLHSSLLVIHNKVKPETFAELPDLHARLAAIDVAPVLARSIRAGLYDEFGWPLLDEVARELDPDGKHLTLHGGPAAVIVASKTRAIAIAATGRLGTHDFVIPAKHELATVRFIGGEFLVVLKEGYRVKCYWSTAPSDLWEAREASVWSLPTLVARSVVLPDGAWLETTTAMRPGDRKLALGGTLSAYDGTTAWTAEWKDGEYRWREVTASGESGRTSWPSWIEAAAEPEWRIHTSSWLFPAPAGVTASPLGISGGMVGARIRYRGKTVHAVDHRELEMIDGTKWAGPPTTNALAVVRFPDSSDVAPIVEDSVWNEGIVVSIYDATGTVETARLAAKERRYCAGSAGVLPVGFWHLLATRDAGGSRRLRALTDDDARALIAAVPATATADAVPVDLPGVLAEVRDPRLRQGLAGYAALAREYQAERDRLATERAPGAAIAPTVAGPEDDHLQEAFAAWLPRQWTQGGSAWAQIQRTADLFAADDRGNRVVTTAPPSIFDWLDFAVAPWAVAFLALAIGTPPEHRKRMHALLEQLQSLPPPAQLRTLVVHGTKHELDDDDETLKPFELRWHDGNAYALRKIGYSGDEVHVLEYAPAGTFKYLPGFTVERELRGTAGPTREDLAALAAAIEQGASSWKPDIARALAEATGLTVHEAALLWAGGPKLHDRGANFLDKALREILGLKASEAAIARDGLNTIALPKRFAAIEEAGRAGVAAILDGSAATTLAAAWIRAVGTRAPIPGELISEANELRFVMQPSLALAMIANAKGAPELTVDGTFALDKDGTAIRVRAAEPFVGQAELDPKPVCFEEGVLKTVAQYVPFLYEHLAVGHPLRAQAAVAYDLALERLRNPALWLDAGGVWLDDQAMAAYDKMLDGLDGEPITGLDDGHRAIRLRAAIVTRERSNASLLVNPAALDDKARTVVDKLVAQVPEYRRETYELLAYLRSDELLAIVARIGKTPVPAGGWEQNPLASASKLVDKLAKHHGLSREGAALYLQYLVLLEPTAKNLQRWNGWTPMQLGAAQDELVDKQLVLEAKRERAGRGYFLPGGWEALKSPHPPMETWKLAFYGSRTPEGAATPRFARFQVLAPFHQLYERAWTRIESGDVPRYEEVKR